MEYNSTLNLLFTHNPYMFLVFAFSGIVISYLAIFFMELSLARLADGGQLRQSFNFARIKYAIDIIGWKKYSIGYTKIILVIFIFSYVEKFFDPYYGLDIIINLISYIIIFVVEFRGIGIVYKVYTDNKKKLDDGKS